MIPRFGKSPISLSTSDDPFPQTGCGGALDYAFKYEDRSALMRLTRQKGICDDILITKDGFITDTSYSNVVLENSEGLFVPHTYLLNGTRGSVYWPMESCRKGLSTRLI